MSADDRAGYGNSEAGTALPFDRNRGQQRIGRERRNPSCSMSSRSRQRSFQGLACNGISCLYGVPGGCVHRRPAHMWRIQTSGAVIALQRDKQRGTKRT